MTQQWNVSHLILWKFNYSISYIITVAAQRQSVLAVLTESELVMLDVSKQAEKVKCGDDIVPRLVNTVVYFRQMTIIIVQY